MKRTPAIVVWVNGTWAIRHNWKHVAIFNTKSEAELALMSGSFPR